MTLRLFENDSYCTAFTATVLFCEQTEKGYATVLDRTAFFPEGGGQPCDLGTINDIPVSDVQEKEGMITHYCCAPLTVGEKVTGQIDFARRFLHMQLHSGEHILSGYIHQLTGLDNVGFHMGSEAVTIDFNGAVSADTLAKAEELTNALIWQNVATELLYPTREELPNIHYRSKKEIQGQVRLVRFPGGDLCACCGTHVARTGEIGMVKVIDCQNYKGGVRITLHAGARALLHYDVVNTALHRAGAMLKVPPTEVPAALEKLQAKCEEQSRTLHDLQRKLWQCEISQIPPGQERHIAFLEKADAEGVRQYCDMLCEKAILALVFSLDENGAKYCLGSRTQDVRPLGKALNAALSGRGGGKPEMVQGSVQATQEQIEAFLEKQHGISES